MRIYHIGLPHEMSREADVESDFRPLLDIHPRTGIDTG